VVDSKGEILKFRYDQKVIEHYDRIYLWGENSVEFVEKVTSNFIVSGNPRFDKLFTDFTFVSPKFEISEFLNKYRFKVLINTSFGSGNNVKSHEELLNFVSQLKGKYFDEEDYELHIAHQKLIFLYVKKLTRLIAAKFKNIGIIIRPHPSENPLGYSDLIQQHPNIYLDKDRKLNAG
jgi:surface carbohydrate biosynthesis protein